MFRTERYNREFNSYTKYFNNGDSRLKMSFKFDVVDAKEHFFLYRRTLCDHGVIENARKHWLLRVFWPKKDMQEYVLCTTSTLSFRY